MPIYGQFVDVTIAKGALESSAVDIGREYDYLAVIIPLMDKCKLSLKVSDRLAGTYYPLGEGQSTDEEIFGRAAIWVLGGWRFLKVVASAKQKAARVIKVKGMRS